MKRLRSVSCGAPAFALAAATAVVVPRLCRAEAYGPADPQLLLLVGAIAAVPAALGCVLSELVYPRRLVGLQWTLGAAGAFVLAVSFALAGTRPYGPGPSPAYYAWIVVPALATLALRGLVPVAYLRLPVGWLVTAGVLGLVQLRHPDAPGRAFLLGAAATCTTLWSITLLAVRLSGAVPTASRQFDAAQWRARFAPLGAAASRQVAEALREGKEVYARLTPARAGLLWWLGSSAVLYFGLGALQAAGLVGQSWFYSALGRWLDFFSWHVPRVSKPIQFWWLYGVPWSLLVGGAVWGLAATMGWFDAGRARAARLAALVLGIAVAGWSIVIAVEIAAVEAAERKLDGRMR